MQCNNCMIKFKSRSLLKQHKNSSHTNEQSFTCYQCSMNFTNNNDLQTHKLKDHNNSKYSCMQCGLQSKKKKKLCSHMKNVHNQDRDLNAQSVDKPNNFSTGQNVTQDLGMDGRQEAQLWLDL